MKKSVRIVTDSTCDLRENLLRKHNIAVVPLRVYFDDSEYVDGLTLKKDNFYNLLGSSQIPPTTSQPPPSDFIDAYNKIKNDGGKKVISLHISSGLSGTMTAAKTAKDFLGEAEINVRLIDSKTTSMGLGYLAMHAALLSQKEDDISIIEREIQAEIPKIKIYFAVPSLRYLKKGGRIGSIQTMLGEFTHTIPILAIKDGKGVLETVKKCKRKNLTRELVDLAKFENSEKGISSLCILHSPHSEDLRELKYSLNESFSHVNIAEEMVGCVLGSHLGPSALGIAIKTDT